MELDDVFSPGGILSSKLPFYSYRDSQYEMAKKVEAAFKDERIAVLEAGTGIGKSFSYLVPAFLEIMRDKKKRVVIATSTITLENQLFEKDIPLINEALGAGVESQILFGRSNYVCLAAFKEKEEELAALTHNSAQEMPVEKRLEIINGIIKEDFSVPITMDMLNSDKTIAIELHPAVMEDLNRQLAQAEQLEQGMQGLQGGQGQYANEGLSVVPEERELPKDTVVMDGNDLAYIHPDKGWYREGRHGREVTVDEIRVEPTETEGKYRMTAVIDGEAVSHEITQKQYDKFMAIDDYHRLKLFSKIFGEVDMKSRDNVPLGTKIGAALLAGVAVMGELGRGPRPDIYLERHGPPPPRCYFKPGVDTPMDVAARNYEAAVNTERMQHEMRHGM